MLSYKGESMIAVNDIEKNIVIFTCTTILQFLSFVTCQPFDPLIQLQRLSQRLCGSVVRNN
jgi:hypothetical protein